VKIDYKGHANSGGIYLITCLVNGKVYIGRTWNFKIRAKQHLWNLRKSAHFNKALQFDFCFYGASAFTFEVFDVIEDSSERAATELALIGEIYGTNGCYNATDQKTPNNLGKKLTPEHREKVRQANLGRKMSSEDREKMSHAHLGVKLSPEHIEKVRQARLGKKRSPETIEKMRQANLGKKASPEAKEKMRQAKLAYHAARRAQPISDSAVAS